MTRHRSLFCAIDYDNDGNKPKTTFNDIFSDITTNFSWNSFQLSDCKANFRFKCSNMDRI